MTTDDYADPDAVEEQARADAIRAEADEIRQRDLGCASCAALRERAEEAEAVLQRLLEWLEKARGGTAASASPVETVCGVLELDGIESAARRVLAERRLT